MSARACAYDWGSDASERVRVRTSACGSAGLSVRKYFVVVRLSAKITFFVTAPILPIGAWERGRHIDVSRSVRVCPAAYSRAGAYGKVHNYRFMTIWW